MDGPFHVLDRPIPVTVVTTQSAADADISPDTLVVSFDPSPHGHQNGERCLVCDARGDIRVMLFDLLTEARRGLRPAFSRVTVTVNDATAASRIADMLTPGRVPALGLRDHVVAKSFELTNAD